MNLSLFVVIVPDRPVCRHPNSSVGVGRRETARVVCEVYANPGDLQFSWGFNGTGGLVELPPSNWTVDRSRSTLLYSPATGAQYGDLLCHARNSLGLQTQPCVFHVLPAGALLCLYPE